MGAPRTLLECPVLADPDPTQVHRYPLRIATRFHRNGNKRSPLLN